MTFLETNRLRLRNVSPKDAIQMVDYRNNERCSKYQRGQTKDYKDIVTLIERNKDNALNLASPTMISVALRETDVMIGEIVVTPMKPCPLSLSIYTSTILSGILSVLLKERTFQV